MFLNTLDHNESRRKIRPSHFDHVKKRIDSASIYEGQILRGNPYSRESIPSMEVIRQRPQWILLSLSSGVCAALNGVFAKLTTSQLTTQWVNEIVRNLGLEEFQMSVEITNRVVCLVFSLSLLHTFMYIYFSVFKLTP